MKVKRLSITDGGNIAVGKICNVYAMLLWKGSLKYLLGDGPYWYSAEQFEIVNPTLPLIWYFTFKEYENVKNNCSYTAIWGYKELVYDKNHNQDLMERKPEALEIFLKRKEEIDEFENPEIKKPISENSYY
jgi:hypothetical protein